MQKNIQKLAKSMVEVQLTLPWSELEAAWNQATETVSQNLELPGFRKGQVPAAMVEQQAQPQIQQEFLKAMMPNALMAALQDTEIVPIDYPQYQIVSFAKGAELKFNARVTVRPEVRVGNYKVLKASRPQLPAVTEEQINQIVMDLFNRWKNRNPLTPGAQSDPTLNAQTNQPNPASPTDPKITEPNDDFAKAMGANDLADLRNKIKTDLEGEAKYNNELDYEENILQEVEKITIVEVPDVLVQDELNRMLVSLQRRVADMGLLMEDYLKGQGKTLDQLKNEWKPQAEKNVKMELGLAEIARQENVAITDEELQAEVDKIQDGRVKQQFEAQEPRMHLRHALRQTRTLNLLKDLVK